jgi:crotonobetainyl-CoA:carnitine CoA-transferase CaiB-like acyl-CoA transferase
MGGALATRGMRLVEFATYVLGPATRKVLGNVGAEVIHIEHPQIGDA